MEGFACHSNEGWEEDEGQRREEEPGLHVMWLGFTGTRHLARTCAHERALSPRPHRRPAVTRTTALRLRPNVQGESSLSLLFSPLHHHDNLLTPAQLHTANISLPSPVTCSSSHPPPQSSHLSRLSTPYLHLRSPVSPAPSLASSTSHIISVPPSLERFAPSWLPSWQKLFYLHFFFCSLSSAPR